MMSDDIKIKFKLTPDNDQKSSHKNAFIIEGGGTRGIYAVGVIECLFDDNKYLNLNDVDIFGGTSVGSFFATALSLGYKKQDFLEYIKFFDLSKFIDSKYLFMITAYRFFSKGYMYDDAERQNIVKKILNLKIQTIREHLGIDFEDKFEGSDITFGHLKKLIKSHPSIYKNLLINSVDVSREEQVFMTTLDDNSDDIKLYDAILASSSFPLVFTPTTLYYNNRTKKYQYDNTNDTSKNTLVDGGVANNNPMDYLLLNNERFNNYNLWLLRFTSSAHHTDVNDNITLIKQIIDFLFSGGKKSNAKLIHEKYQVNTINLNVTAKTFDTYTNQQIQKIAKDTFQQCIGGRLRFED
ncbi:putative patatin phospholipase [Cotonvirus japonicus]|uniref:Patatin phospholipase n=1 Tax=Cotonvirus japonicus TaxID=2811091 RepID=A0ABM7NTL8_9VIRU|nr:putative patatin phospholipase [Cotonvirus japonicus]BCS83441.1 putative patatin phospholipase [Cotonvirus japonicus]